MLTGSFSSPRSLLNSEPQLVKARIQTGRNPSEGRKDTLLLILQEKCEQGARTFCSDLLSVLLDSADWLFIFKPSGTYMCSHTLTRVDIVWYRKRTFVVAQMGIWLQ